MFEHYTEKARRVIFFARYEASQFGSPYIETEHMLLGMLREDPGLVFRFHLPAEAIRQQIDRATVIREQVSTSVDLPLSDESKRVLSYAAEEAEVLGNKHIGTEHLFLGLLREEKSLAAELLRGAGIRLKDARKQIAKSPGDPALNRVVRPPFQDVPVVVYLENGEAISSTPLLHWLLPRPEDELLMKSEDGSTRTFHVDKVRFVVLDDINQLEKVEVVVTRISSP